MLYLALIIADILSYLIIILKDAAIIDSWRIPATAGIYLIGKAFVYRDTMSILDGLVGLYAFLIIFGLQFWFVYFVIAYLAYKIISLAI